MDRTAKGAESVALDLDGKLRLCQHAPDAQRDIEAQLLVIDELLEAAERELNQLESWAAIDERFEMLGSIELRLATAAASIDSMEITELERDLEELVDASGQLDPSATPERVGRVLTEAQGAAKHAVTRLGDLPDGRPARPVRSRVQAAQDRISAARNRLEALMRPEE